LTLEEFRDYCQRKKGSIEGLPYGETTVVYKISGKIFAMADAVSFKNVTLKCNPDKAVELRNQYPAVIPGYRLSKKHWNTIRMDGSVPDKVIYSLIDHSYAMTYSGLNRAEAQNVDDW
jgi:predicted DNA-binding protein (MmcQ/YjbR family)